MKENKQRKYGDKDPNDKKTIDLNDYKKQREIPPPRSPYYALDATDEEIYEAVERAKRLMSETFDYRKQPPYAVLFGYKNIKTGKAKLLKSMEVYPSEQVFNQMAGIGGHNILAVVDGINYHHD